MSDSELAKIKGLAEEIDANEMVPAGFFAPTVVRLCDRLESSEAALRTLREASADLQKSVEILAKKSIGYERDESIVMTMFLEDVTNKANIVAAALAAEGGK